MESRAALLLLGMGVSRASEIFAGKELLPLVRSTRGQDNPSSRTSAGGFVILQPGVCASRSRGGAFQGPPPGGVSLARPKVMSQGRGR